MMKEYEMQEKFSYPLVIIGMIFGGLMLIGSMTAIIALSLMNSKIAYIGIGALGLFIGAVLFSIFGSKLYIMKYGNREYYQVI